MHNVVVYRYEENSSVVKKAIDDSMGFSGLKKSDKVLIKPNIVWGGGLMRGVPRYGFITTGQVIEEIVLALIDFGCQPKNITIGEGSVVSKELKSTTKNGFKWSGMKKLQRHGVKFLDFNVDQFTEVESHGIKMEIANAIFQSDFVINVPVLKTHFMTGVSLGMKNLKGCLSITSKKRFHTSTKLKKSIAAMNVAFHELGKPNLTIVDGIYSLEGGPSPNGTASRTNLIIAGKDPLSVDLVGCGILGVNISDVEYFSEYSAMTQKKLDIESINVMGEKIDDVKLNYSFAIDYEKIFNSVNINGISMKDSGDTLCTGCVTNIEAAILCYTADNRNMTLDKKVEICAANRVIPDADSDIVFLFGKCACNKNRNLVKSSGNQKIVEIKGCTPTLTSFLWSLYKETLPTGQFILKFSTRLLKTVGTALHIYNEDLLKKNYSYPDFDKNHYI